MTRVLTVLGLLGSVALAFASGSPARIPSPARGSLAPLYAERVLVAFLIYSLCLSAVTAAWRGELLARR